MSERFPIGARVRVKSKDGAMIETTIEGRPWYLGSGKGLIKLKGLGSRPLKDVELVPEAAAQGGYSYGAMGAGP